MGFLRNLLGNKEQPKEPEEEYTTYYPCLSIHCEHFLTYKITNKPKKLFNPLPDLIIYCLFCNRFKKQDMYQPKEKTHGV
jgi:hypothetical protein